MARDRMRGRGADQRTATKVQGINPHNRPWPQSPALPGAQVNKKGPSKRDVNLPSPDCPVEWLPIWADIWPQPPWRAAPVQDRARRIGVEFVHEARGTGGGVRSVQHCRGL